MPQKSFFAALLILSTAVNAQPGSSDGDLRGTRPNAGGAPDEIAVGVGLLDIAEIDDRKQVFMADIYVRVEWRDPRLALDSAARDDLRTVELDDIWHPRLTVINSRRLDRLFPDTATLDREGNVIVRQRLAGPLAVGLDLREFPFDTQRLAIEVVSYQYSPAEIVFSADSELVADLDRLSGDGWVYTATEMEPYEFRLKDDGRAAAALRFAVSAERKPAYFVFTLALPMTLILFLAWMVHWLPVDVIPARIGTASATVFSLIAFGVSFRLTLPKIAYLTDADRFVLYSTLLVLVSLAVTVVSIRRVGAEQKDAAERLTRQARLAFPFLYVLIVLLTFST
jgi:gamma-aminobutyric acid receptor subunit beta